MLVCCFDSWFLTQTGTSITDSNGKNKGKSFYPTSTTKDRKLKKKTKGSGEANVGGQTKNPTWNSLKTSSVIIGVYAHISTHHHVRI
jgi:hypothetical protein